MVDGAGSIGPRNVRGHVRRRSAERWAAATIREIRAGRVQAGDPPSPAAATARFVAFAALALHCDPEAPEPDPVPAGQRLRDQPGWVTGVGTVPACGDCPRSPGVMRPTGAGSP